MLLRDKNDFLQEIAPFMRDCPATSATATYAIASVKAAYLLERIEVIVDAAYAADPANYYRLQLVHGGGATVAGTWSTLTGQEGALAAGTPGQMTLSVAANLVCAVGDVLSLVATKNGTAANITPRVVIHGRYL